MNNPIATRRVVTQLESDLGGSAHVVMPLIDYAEANFQTLDDRLRFLALVIFTACQRSNFGPAMTKRALPAACEDIYQELSRVDQRRHTIH